MKNCNLFAKVKNLIENHCIYSKSHGLLGKLLLNNCLLRSQVSPLSDIINDSENNKIRSPVVDCMTLLQMIKDVIRIHFGLFDFLMKFHNSKLAR